MGLVFVHRAELIELPAGKGRRGRESGKGLANDYSQPKLALIVADVCLHIRVS